MLTFITILYFDISEHIDRYIENLGKDQELKKGGEYTLTLNIVFGKM